jgi:hypothetical protein
VAPNVPKCLASYSIVRRRLENSNSAPLFGRLSHDGCFSVARCCLNTRFSKRLPHCRSIFRKRTVTGLPPEATATFSPATIAAGSSTSTVKLTIQTSSSQAANTGSQRQGPIALAMLLLPVLGIVSLRKRLGRMPQLRAAIVLGVLSLGAIMGSTGCAGGTGTITPPSTSYTVAVTAHCGTLQQSVDAIIKIEN